MRPEDDLIEYADRSVAKIKSALEKLNEAGSKGWEVVCVHSEEGNGWRDNVYLLKRVKP